MAALNFDDIQPQSKRNVLTFDDVETPTNAIGDVFNSRANELADNIVAYKNNEKSAPELAMNFIGKAGAGTANDLIGVGINAAMPDAVKQGLATGAQATSDAIDGTRFGQSAGDALMALRDKYSEFKQSNPRITSQLESAGNLASILPIAKASQPISNIANEVASNTGTGIKGLAEAYATKYPNSTGPLDPIKMRVAQPITGDVAKNAAQNAYKDVEYLGGQFTPALADDAHNIIQSSKVRPFAGDILTKQDAAINSSLADYDSLAGKSLTLDDYRRLDSSLGDKAAEAFVAGKANEGRIIAQAQDQIRDLIRSDKLDQKYVAGSKEGVEVLTKDAIPLWSAQAKMADIQKIVDRANMMDNPTTAMRTGFRNLAFNKKRMTTYPKNVQKLIIQAADTGRVDDLLGVLGSRLNGIIGGAVGGPQGAAIGGGVSMGFRGVRNAIRNKKADKVINTLVEPLRPSIDKYRFAEPDVQKLTMREIMMMPPAQARAALAKYKSKPAP